MSAVLTDLPPALASKSAWALVLEQRFDLLDPEPDPGLPLAGESLSLLLEICAALEAGELRVAEPAADGRWIVHGWIKRALLMLGAAGQVCPQTGPVAGTEISTLGWIETRAMANRIPAGSYLRRGSFLGAGCSIMPPSTVQAGAYLAANARVDSHVLVGSCAQIGEDVVLGCGAMIAGVLLPEAALPVILERRVIVGGNSGIYGSVLVGESAVLRPGTILHAAHGLYDQTRHAWLVAEAGQPLVVPPHAEIGMGLAPLDRCTDGIQHLTPMILNRGGEAEDSPRRTFGGQR